MMQDGVLHVNNVMQEEEFIDEENKATYDFGSRRIEKDKCYFLGDNRNVSYDSSDYGSIDRNKIIGQFWFVWRYYHTIAVTGICATVIYLV